MSIPRNLGNLFTFGFLFAVLVRVIITQLFMLQSKLLTTVMKWCCKKQYCMLYLCDVHRDGLVLNTSRMKFCCLYRSQDVFVWFLDCAWQIYYAYSCFLLCMTSPLSEHGVVAPLMSPCTRGEWTCYCFTCL